ncbi:hypothetical protein JCM8547_005525 [Rhodosporidiobolus lusitaniae]
MNPPMQAASARFVGAPRPSSDTLFATWSSFKAGDEGDEDAGQELARHLVFLRKRTLFDLAECEERENEYESDKEAAASQSPLQDAVEYVDEDREGQDEGAENASAGRPKPSPQPCGNTAVSPIHRPSPSSLPPPSMDDVDDRTPLSSSDHTAFLTSFFPTSSSTDLTSTANFLHPAGLSTVEDLAAFLAIDAGLYAVVVEKAIKKGRLGQEEAARVREVLKVAREAFEAQ